MIYAGRSWTSGSRDGNSTVKHAPALPALFAARIPHQCASIIERHIRQPLPIPLAFVVKKLSKSRQKHSGNAGTVIDDFEFHIIIFRDARRNQYLARTAFTLNHRLHGVDCQIDDHLLKLHGITVQAG